MKIQVVYTSRAEAYRARQIKRAVRMMLRDSLKVLIALAVIALMLTAMAVDSMELDTAVKALFGSMIAIAVASGAYKRMFGGQRHDVRG